MTRDIINNQYFNWMCKLVYDRRRTEGRSYRELLNYLHRVDFIYIIGMDGNRAEDGISLRYRFAYENNYNLVRSFQQ